MKVRAVASALEATAPLRLAAEWDNVGLLVGDGEAKVTKLMLCIDLTEGVLAEAIKARAQMVMAYHPVIFKPLARVTADDAPVVFSAASSGIAVYSMHTALDATPGGTNDVLAEVLGIAQPRPLEPLALNDECKIVVFAPAEELSDVAQAAFGAGAGRIGNYHDCAFFCHGIGTFCGGVGAQPTIGHVGHHEVAEELRLEMIAPASKAAAVCSAIREAHSYEEPAIDVYPIQSTPRDCGMGRIGKLTRPAAVGTLLARIKKAFGVKSVLVAKSGKQSKGRKKPDLVTTAACYAGSGGSLYRLAAAAGATFYLTGEMRHHDALAASAAGVTVACLGHSNSERLTLSRLAKQLRKALPTVGVVVSRRDKDPFEIV